ncbi:hypothetical protein [Pseudomonas boanensis]|uniref:hypothetical protein n=1 Tax=Metapseudomonas boanensis TaxID=2822138 RepID=UPI0035D4AFED
MSETELINFHFIDLKGPIAGPDEQPADVSEHRTLSINKGSILKLIASRESTNIGDPVPGMTPSPIDTQLAPPPQSSLLTGSALDAAYSLPTISAETSGESESSKAAEPAPQLENTPETDLEADLTEQVALDEYEQEPAASEPQAQASLTDPESPTEAPIVEAEAEAPAASDLETHDLLKLSPPAAGTLAEPGLDDTAPVKVAAEPLPVHMTEIDLENTAVSDTDSVLVDVQATLNSLADMAKGLTQQKLEAVKQQESLDQRKSHLCEKERLLAEKDEQLRTLETRLHLEASAIERAAEDNARALSERSAALKALAENVEARDRNTAKFAESLRQEKLRYETKAEQLRKQAEALDDREASLNRKEEELAEKLKQLISAKDRFRSIVKTFNETVQFNNTLNAISSTVLDDTSL